MTLSPSLRLVQLSDTHLFAEAERQMRGCTTAATLAAVVERLQTLPRPDALLLTGDLSQDETTASYERLRRLIDPLGIPAYWIPGNHDRLEAMEAVLSSEPWQRARVWQGGGWNMVLLNSRQPGAVAGYLAAESLSWLELQLQQCPLPTLVALHHHPYPIGLEQMDGLWLQNAEEFWQVLDRYPQVRLVVFGHIHQDFLACRNGVVCLGCPSTCIQFQPLQATVVADGLTPGLRQIDLYKDGQFRSYVHRIG